MIALKPSFNTQIELPMPAISALCRKYGVEQLAVFGSVLRDDFHADSDVVHISALGCDADSDVDFLVVFQNNDYGPWMGKLTDLEEELSSLLQRKVDLIDKHGVEQNRNWIIRKSILESAQVIYES